MMLLKSGLKKGLMTANDDNTLARTDLLYMLNWGTQWTMVSYFKKINKN